MLVLALRQNESVLIGDNIRVCINRFSSFDVNKHRELDVKFVDRLTGQEISSDRIVVRLAFEAPREILILREELLDTKF